MGPGRASSQSTGRDTHLKRKKPERNFSFTEGKCSGNFILQNLPTRISPLPVPDTAPGRAPRLGTPSAESLALEVPQLLSRLLTLRSPGHLVPVGAEETASEDPPASSRVSRRRTGCPPTTPRAVGKLDPGGQSGVPQRTNAVLCRAAGVRQAPERAPTYRGGSPPPQGTVCPNELHLQPNARSEHTQTTA